MACTFELLKKKNTMAGNFHSLSAKIGQLTRKQTVLRRILLELMPLILALPARVNFKEMSRYGQRNETTYHNWFKRVLDLVS